MLGDLRGFMPEVFPHAKKKNKAERKSSLAPIRQQHNSSLIPENTVSMLSNHYLLPNIDVN